MTTAKPRPIGKSEIEITPRKQAYPVGIARTVYPTVTVRRNPPKPILRKVLTAKQRREMPYEEYLKTSYWAAKRRAAIIRAQGRCQICNSNLSLQVHHRTYERRGCEHAADLTVLCKRCHERHHLPQETKK